MNDYPARREDLEGMGGGSTTLNLLLVEIMEEYAVEERCDIYSCMAVCPEGCNMYRLQPTASTN